MTTSEQLGGSLEIPSYGFGGCLLYRGKLLGICIIFNYVCSKIFNQRIKDWWNKV
jgi:hypothetical protein